MALPEALAFIKATGDAVYPGSKSIGRWISFVRFSDGQGFVHAAEDSAYYLATTAFTLWPELRDSPDTEDGYGT